ncbi:hypothetical protein LBWT_38770 [Leptolyngbya boryana IAM M-101]|nr:hypothetical protein LBWT_38770 [Leptolyngbya boryana IAM M-101]BAS64260.1 hypothetical protein LBDG_38770 [Leptolyngbya boryana dg5]
MQNQQPQQQKEAACFASEGVKAKQPLLEIQKWEILDKEIKTESDDPDSKYSLVRAKIQEKSLGGMVVDRTWIFKVWNSTELFERNKRMFDKSNRDGQRVMQQANEVLKAAGKEPVEAPKPIVPNREQYSSRPYCIVAYEGQ